MKVAYHPAVRRDMAEAMRHYRSISNALADEFKAEVGAIIQMAIENPDRFDCSGLPHGAVELLQDAGGNRVGNAQTASSQRVGGDGGPSRQIRRALNDIRCARLAIEEKLHMSGLDVQRGKRGSLRFKREECQRQGRERIGEVRAGRRIARCGDVLQ